MWREQRAEDSSAQLTQLLRTRHPCPPPTTWTRQTSGQQRERTHALKVAGVTRLGADARKAGPGLREALGRRPGRSSVRTGCMLPPPRPAILPRGLWHGASWPDDLPLIKCDAISPSLCMFSIIFTAALCRILVWLGLVCLFFLLSISNSPRNIFGPEAQWQQLWLFYSINRASEKSTYYSVFSSALYYLNLLRELK